MRPAPGVPLMLTDTEAALIRRVRARLEAVWECSTPLACGYGQLAGMKQCERCRTLDELDDLLAQQ